MDIEDPSSCLNDQIPSGASRLARDPTLGDEYPGMAMGMTEWRYEMRREAQLIIPGLYLGPFQASLNAAKMKSMGITHVLCIRDEKEARLIFPRFPTEFKYMTLDISDHPDQNIISLFPDCRDFIEEALSMGGTVLAHCNGGIALSPAIVIGYLMWKFDWNPELALALIQSKRYCVSTNTFHNQFKEYEPIYMAQKMVESADKCNSKSVKRQVEQESEWYHIPGLLQADFRVFCSDDDGTGRYRRKIRPAPDDDDMDTNMN